MKIKRQLVPEMTIKKFADLHQLTMEIHERRKPIDGSGRYCASFRGAELMEPGVLVGAFGDGATEEEAIKNYARRISLGRLCFNAYDTIKRREIDVPRLKEK